MIERDVNNMRDYYGLYAPELLTTQYAKEIWALYEAGELTPEVELTGEFIADEHEADVDAVLEEIKAAFEEAEERSEEHTSELQSRPHLVCRLLLEKKKQ